MGRQSSVVTLATAMLLSFVPTGAKSPLSSARRNGPSVELTDSAHRVYKDLQSIPPGGVWQESFWIRPSGF